MSFPSFFSVCSTFYNGKGGENIADVLCINVFLAFGRLETVLPTRDGRPGAWKCLPGSGTHFLHPKNAFPGWEMTFYPQKMASHAGKAFFDVRKGRPESGGSLTCATRHISAPVDIPGSGAGQQGWFFFACKKNPRNACKLFLLFYVPGIK